MRYQEDISSFSWTPSSAQASRASKLYHANVTLSQRAPRQHVFNSSRKYKQSYPFATLMSLQAKANTRDAEDSHCYWKYPRCLYRGWCSCWERVEVSAGLRGRRRCTYPPAESGAVMQCFISYCAVQSKGETPPSVSLQGKSYLAEWDDLSDPGRLWGSCDDRVCMSACVCALSAVS